MKSIIFVLAVAISTTSITAMSTDVLAAPSRVMKLLREQAHKNNPVRKDKGLCTNFTGEWRGTCVDSAGETYSDWMKIRQWDCGSLSIDGDGYSDDLEANSLQRIGGTTFDYMSDFNATAGMEWNIARSILTTKFVGSFQTFGSIGSGTLEGTKSFELRDGQLLTKSQQKNRTNDGQSEDITGDECTYSK